MPVIHREYGWSLVVYPNDHPPPHVHAWYGDGEVKVSIPPPGEPVSVLRVSKLATHHAVRAVRMVENHRELLRSAWSEIHD
jgi:hypothetical protein